MSARRTAVRLNRRELIVMGVGVAGSLVIGLPAAASVEGDEDRVATTWPLVAGDEEFIEMAWTPAAGGWSSRARWPSTSRTTVGTCG